MGMMYFEDLNVGDSWTSAERTVDHEEMLAYGRTNDPWMYRMSHEMVNQPDRVWAFLGGFDWHVKLLEPVRSGDRLHERITILEKRLSSKPGRGIVKNLIEVINDRKRMVLSIESTAQMATASSQ